MKKYRIIYRSRYYSCDTDRCTVLAPSKKWIRDNWHSLMHTDEYRIVKIEEV